MPKGTSAEAIGWTAALALLVAFVLCNAERGAISPSTVNLAGLGKPRPVEPLFPSLDVVFWGQVMAAILAVVMVVGFVYAWRRQPRHPFLLMILASTSICWLDPLNNWSIYLVYNPALWHFPQDWPWVGLSPIIEPLMNFVYAPYVVMPYPIAISLLRRLQSNRSMTSFVWRHPLVSLGALTFAVTVVWDSLLEVFLVATQFYTYSHVVPFGSIFKGTPHQFPLLMASGLITIVTVPAAVMLYRDDTGLSQGEQLAQRLKLYRARPGTATFLVMAGTLNLAFMMFIACFFSVRVMGLATSVACPWPYQESVVYDPNGFYEQQGQSGPFWEGRMNDWIPALPGGRPTTVARISTRCDRSDVSRSVSP